MRQVTSKFFCENADLVMRWVDEDGSVAILCDETGERIAYISCPKDGVFEDDD